MSSNSTHNSKKQKYESFKSIEQKFEKIPFNKLAIETDFKQRKGKKITGKRLVITFILMAMQGINTYEHWGN